MFTLGAIFVWTIQSVIQAIFLILSLLVLFAIGYAIDIWFGICFSKSFGLV
jgi:hypothetical protein